MRFSNLIKIAYRSLMKNKLRTILTMIGIIIGVASIVTMMGIGEGSSSSIKSSFSSLGVNAIMIMPGAQNNGGVRSDAGTGQNMTVEDADAIREFCPDISALSPIVRTSAQTVYGSQNWHTSIFGVNTEYFTVRNLKIPKGTCFTMAENKSSAKVCIIGETVVTNLFGAGANALGQTIRINKIPFRVIGILEKKGQNSFGQDQDDVILGPFYTVQKRMLGTTNVGQIIASSTNEKVTNKAVDEITEILMQRHKILDPEDADFTIRTQSEISNIFGSISTVLGVLLTIMAFISLIVGGIGIMNIMLVSITERTREIGLRMAIGAKGKDILLQFLIEAVFLSLIGGFIGLGLGVLFSNLVGLFAGWPIIITTNSVIFAFGSATFIGIIFGYLPARKAAHMRPIEALRYE